MYIVQDFLKKVFVAIVFLVFKFLKFNVFCNGLIDKLAQVKHMLGIVMLGGGMYLPLTLVHSGYTKSWLEGIPAGFCIKTPNVAAVAMPTVVCTVICTRVN